jgi:hypothetical protein
MPANLIVRLPADDAADLNDLVDRLGSDEEVELVQPFDGATEAQVLVALSTATLPFFRTWMKARLEARKGFVVMHDGNEYKGYTAEEVSQILHVVDENAAT